MRQMRVFPRQETTIFVSASKRVRERAPTAVKQVSLNVIVVVGNGNHHGETGDPFLYSRCISVLAYRRNRRLYKGGGWVSMENRE